MELRDQKGLTEAEFLEQYRQRAGKYPRPFLTADCVILAPSERAGARRVLLIRRGGHPYLGCLALPGGFAQSDETMEQSAERELMEETGVHAPMRLLGIYSTPGRDPRGWVVTAAYLADLPAKPDAQAADDAADAIWAEISLDPDGNLRLQTEKEAILLASPAYSHPAIAFDHGRILADALRSL